jgi:thiamine-monophosphate kinase
MSVDIALGPGAEFDAIRSMIDRWGNRAIGLGDDAAELKVPRGETLVVSVDAAVERIHFKLEWLTPREIAYRAVTAALSDIAAMAATPLGILTAITLPARWRASLEDLAGGIADAVEAAQTVIRGGNLSDGPELTIATTVLGSAFKPIGRHTAKPSDSVYVTGKLGGPAAALRLVESGQEAGRLRDRLARPVARIHEARWLADNGASSLIDVSDGLTSDLRHLAAASGVSIEIDADRVPRFEGVDVRDALAGGEEYELIVTTPHDFDDVAFAARFGTPLTRIGVAGSREQESIVIRGAVVAGLRGYDHFSQ